MIITKKIITIIMFILEERQYNSSFGKEVLISFDESIIFAFVRLRISMNWDFLIKLIIMLILMVLQIMMI